MATLLEVRTSSGTVRRCDSVCHSASGGTCHCVCGGMFHGIGSSRAEQVTAMMLDAARKSIALDESESIQLRIGV